VKKKPSVPLADIEFYKQPWTTADDRALDELMTKTQMTRELFKLLLKAMACSEGIDRSAWPAEFLPTLMEKYCLGPVDKAGVPYRLRRTIN
jgi:hypothetical protein